jgi:iron complex outermembrane receptor protein
MENARTLFASTFLALALCVLVTPAVSQQETADEPNDAAEDEGTEPPTDQMLPETVVTESRMEQPISETTRSVTVLDRSDIERETAISRDIGDLLGKNVPGMATSTGALTSFTQTLRGREFLTLIDGVPISTPLRDGARDLKVISPEALERIEVLRGGSAVYGFGATGGIINYQTREPDRGDDLVQGFSQLRLGISTEEVSSDSLETSTTHGAYGQVGSYDYLLNATVADRNQFFDSEGDRIPTEPFSNQGGLADTLEWNVLAKTGYDFNDGQERLQILLNNYDIEQDTDFVTQNGDFNEREKAVGVPGDPQGKKMKTEKTMAQIKYTNDRVLSSRLKLNTYYLDRLARFGFSPSFQSQSQLESERFGSRLTMNTPLTEQGGTELIWGLDAMNEELQQNPIAGANPFGTDPVPLLDTTALAGFAELSVPLDELAELRFGARHEQFWMSVDDYQNFEQTNTVEGGDLRFNETLFNVNGVIHMSDQVDLFGGFSQGFRPSEVGRVLREQADGGDSVEKIDPKAQTVDNFEIGVRSTTGTLTGSITGFHSQSDLGTTFDSNLQVERNEEEIWGLETDLQYELTDHWTVGNTNTIIHSYTDGDGDGNLDEDLPNTRIPPLKVTGFVEFAPSDRFSTRLRGLFSGDREPNASGFGASEVNAFKVFDLYASYRLTYGTLSLGVENLLNEEYFPVANQAFGLDSTLARGKGRTVSISYKLNW